MKKCAKCGRAWTEEGRLSFHAVCPDCLTELHSCIHCRLYAPHAHNHCLSPTTEAVRDVRRANFCEEFEFAERDGAAPSPDAGAAKDKFKRLFGDG